MPYQETITKEEIATFPPFAFEGEVRVIETPEEVDNAVAYLASQPCIGFDTETRPAFHKGEHYTVGLLQLAAPDCVFLFRLNKCGFSISIRRLMSNAYVQKVGVGIRDDIRMLQEKGPFTPGGCIDLQSVAEKYGIMEKSFYKLMAIIFRVRISKRQQVSNWNADHLTPQQVVYAATDAWGSLKMYQRLTETA